MLGGHSADPVCESVGRVRPVIQVLTASYTEGFFNVLATFHSKRIDLMLELQHQSIISEMKYTPADKIPDQKNLFQ